MRIEFEFVVDWRPFLLRPDAPEEGWALPEKYRLMALDPTYPLKLRADALGLPLKHRDHVPNTRRAHECTEYARAHGQLQPFHHQVIDRYWGRGEDIHDWAVLRSAAVDAGLEPDAMQAEVEAGKWRTEMQAGIQAGADLGVNAVPTFIVGNRFSIQGAQEARVFRQAFERLKAGL